jgi:DNA-binding transcriptional regulator YiaG
MATAREIRRIHSQEGVSVPELAKRYGVSQGTMHQLLKGETWREPTATRRPPVQRRKALSNEEIAQIKRLHSSGLSQVRIGFIVGVSSTTVGKVLKSP